MEKDKINEYTRRIAQSNRSEMIVVMYDIFFSYIEDAISSHNAADYEQFKRNIKNADRVVAQLQNSLNFSYALSTELYPLYSFVRKTIMLGITRNQIQELKDAERIMHNLYVAFVEVAKQDHSEAFMKNTQQVYAGMTYGKNNLTETFQQADTSRGFLA